jgi:hypothetical protein
MLRRLLVAATLALLVGGLAWWSSRSKPSEDAKRKEGSRELLSLKTADLRKIEIRRRDAETTVLESSDGTSWRLTAPIAAATDADTVSTLTSNLAPLSAEEIVEEKAADLAAFGLADPAWTMTVTLQGGKTHTLNLGDEAPVGSGSYGRLDAGQRVFTIASFTKTALDKFAADLRDRRLLTVNFDQLKKVQLVSPKGAVEFERQEPSGWRIVQPTSARADGWKVEEVIRKFREARFDASLTSDEQKDVASAFASAPLLARVTFTDGAASQTIELRRNEKAKKTYARSPVIEGPQLVQGDSIDGLDQTAADFRNKKLFDFGFDEPTTVSLVSPELSLTVNKSGDKWASGGKEMDAVSVQSFIDRLRELTATGFPAAAMPASTIEIGVTSNQGKRIEKVRLAQSAGKWFAQRDGEAGLYELEASAVDNTLKTAKDVRETPPPPKAPAKK